MYIALIVARKWVRRMTKLKQCPFCGSNKIIKLYADDLSICICCNMCGGRTQHCKKDIDAIKAWNTRKGEEDDE